MADVFLFETRESISLQECIARLTDISHPLNEDNISSAAELLVKLRNNREFLPAYMNGLLKEAFDGKQFKRSSRIFPLYESAEFTLRALVWEPVPLGVNGAQFFYNIPHDHDFDFITTSYFGPPMDSEVYQYDNEKISGYPGETVPLRRQGRLSVTSGSAHSYRAGKDIHIQLAPPSLAITLNVIGPKRIAKSPWWFDVEKQAIVDWVDHTENAQLLLVRAAQYAHDEETIGLLQSLSSESPSSRVRELTKSVLVSITESTS